MHARSAQIAILLALGAAGGLIGDAAHVQSGTTHYIDHGVPFIWESTFWFVLMVAAGTVALADLRVRFLGPTRPATVIEGAGGILAVVGLYALTAALRHADLAAATLIIYAVAAVILWLTADRAGLLCGVLAAITGTVVEIVLAKLDVFGYGADINTLAGVTPWLPGLYLAFGAVAARLGELLLVRP